MKNIILVCSAGLTSAKIVAKMKETAESRSDVEVTISSTGVGGLSNSIHNADIVLLSPQSAYLMDVMKDLIKENVVVKAMTPELYSSLDGNLIVDFALE